MSEGLRMQIGGLPRVRLANLPTPLQKAGNLSKRLRGPSILIKRDDLTGLAFGGNKTRILEFVMGMLRPRGLMLSWLGLVGSRIGVVRWLRLRTG